MDIPPTDWELDKMFGLGNIAVWTKCNWIQVAGNHRSTLILDKVYMAFFHCKDFLHWAYTPNLPATFLLTLEIKFEKGLYLQKEGSDTDVNYDFP